jgi:hypothetical protein
LPEKLTAYALDWHLTDSRAFDSLLVEPLADHAQIELRSWDGEALPERIPPDRHSIFCMLPPPAQVLRDPSARLVWIPMWDQARTYAPSWWEQLPPNLRVVAFAEPVRRLAQGAGLQTLPLTYFLDPAQLPSAEWGERVGFYWNRTGMLGPPAVERLCRSLGISRLIFRDRIDPRIPPGMHYSLPRSLGDTEVVTVDPNSREEYLDATQPANIVVAPRTAEGVGLTFLEGMARGCCVIGYDAPTMNEYIRHGENGMLFRRRESRLRVAALRRVLRRMPHIVDVDQPWGRLRRADPIRLGERARADHVAGHARWVASIDEYARFILDW